jgi:hypothetical protein
LDLRRGKWREAGEENIMRSFITCTLHKMGVLKSRLIRCPGHETRMVELRNTYEILFGKLDGKTLPRKA